MKNLQRIWGKVKEHALRQEQGIDGILVTVGLCIIALLLCVVMKDSLTTFIQTIVTAMQTKAADILTVYGTQLGELWSVVTVGDCTQALSRAYYGDLSGCTNIARAEHFAFSSLKNYMYYAVGGTVYRVDLSEKPLTATTQFTLVGETVTCLKFNISRQSANLTRTYDLVVGSVKDDTGTLRIYEGFNSDGNFRGVCSWRCRSCICSC